MFFAPPGVVACGEALAVLFLVLGQVWGRGFSRRAQWQRESRENPRLLPLEAVARQPRRTGSRQSRRCVAPGLRAACAPLCNSDKA